MAATPSPSLFDLIKSLSKSEKRYFKVFSSKHTIGEENNYIILFDYLDSMNVYNEEQIHEEFKGQALLNKFSITKKRLQENIMRALDSYHANSSVESQLYRMLHYAEILYDKSLYSQCKKYLSSAEKLARKHGKHHVLLEINTKIKKLLENTGYSGVQDLHLEEMMKEDLLILNQTRDFNLLWNIKSKLILRLNTKGIARSEEDLQTFEAIFKELDNVQFTENFDNRYLINHIHAAYYFALGDFDNSLTYILLNKELFEENEDRLNEDINVYFSLITNAIYINNQLGRYANVDVLLTELKSIALKLGDTASDDMNIKLFSSINSTELMLLNGRGEFKKALLLVPLIEEGYRLYGDKINKSRRAYLNYNIAVAYFGIQDFSGALKWINTILNDKEFDEKQDIYCFAQLLNLIVHFELNHHQLLPYAIKSTQRYLKSRNRVYKFEEIFLKYLNKLSRTEQPLDQLDLLEEVLHQIKPLANDPFESNVLDSFKFILWAESKIKKIPFSELVESAYYERSK